MLVNQTVMQKWHSTTRKHYMERGYVFTKNGDLFEVKVADLTPSSEVEITVQCDYCKEVFQMMYKDYNKRVLHGTIQKVSCKTCKPKKQAETNLIKYGVTNTSKLDSIKEKRKQTNLERYGVPYTMMSEEAKAKAKKTVMDKYGVEYVGQAKEVKEKIQSTRKERYGTEDGKERLRNAIQNNNRKYTWETVRSHFEEEGCVLVSESYQNTEEPLAYICVCGTPSTIRYSDFRQGKRCKTCRDKTLRELFQHDFEMVKETFKQSGCKLLSKEYVNEGESLEFRCICGKVATTTFGSFKKGHYCWECGNDKKRKKRQHPVQYIYSYVDKKGYTFIKWLEDYKNQYSAFLVCCPNGHEYETNYCNLSRCGCGDCYGNKNIGHNRFLEIIEDLTQGEYTVLGEYMNSNTNVLMRHNLCGHKWCANSSSFIHSDTRCPQCQPASKGEDKIQKLLKECGISFLREYKFEDCRNIRPLPFDFAVFDKVGELVFLIEYDGIQHFEARFGEEDLRRLQENDQRKNIYCEENGIKLIRIPYWDYKNIEFIVKSAL
ncbi:hypothetical protein COF61_09215 [Bacillus toyonensis]|uniref:DUF7487 domain-containing protein n=1 Tax=Bacillus toyonensis TaxID=155322 RepID=UPI000BFD70BC|nr:hypothetical protein [Bacillus toyonensis]PHD66631.1 hypothetical protein COF61_09215 [Bacillus toyonensis]